MAHHLAPYGSEVYKIEEDQYNLSKIQMETNAKQIIVGGRNAIESFTAMSKDIHGNIYNPALKLIHVVFPG